MHWISASDSGFVPASHENPQNPGVLKRVIATRDMFQAGHVQMLNWASLPAGSSFQPHYHEDMQEVFVMLSGSVEMHISGETRRMGPGDTVLVDPREIHRMTNVGTEAAEYIVFGISSGKGGRTVVV
ncbi:MAG: cupin domain-containing protein [Planctomycetaceae bacterium]|nr:cupin domain-containing protein [Planctomycetaceae bacterium]